MDLEAIEIRGPSVGDGLGKKPQNNSRIIRKKPTIWKSHMLAIFGWGRIVSLLKKRWTVDPKLSSVVDATGFKLRSSGWWFCSRPKIRIGFRGAEETNQRGPRALERPGGLEDDFCGGCPNFRNYIEASAQKTRA